MIVRGCERIGSSTRFYDSECLYKPRNLLMFQITQHPNGDVAKNLEESFTKDIRGSFQLIINIADYFEKSFLINGGLFSLFLNPCCRVT